MIYLQFHLLPLELHEAQLALLFIPQCLLGLTLPEIAVTQKLVVVEGWYTLRILLIRKG